MADVAASGGYYMAMVGHSSMRVLCCVICRATRVPKCGHLCFAEGSGLVGRLDLERLFSLREASAPAPVLIICAMLLRCDHMCALCVAAGLVTHPSEHKGKVCVHLAWVRALAVPASP